VIGRNRAGGARLAAAGLVRRAVVSDPDALRVSVVIPAYQEGEAIVPVLERLFEAVMLRCEVLVVVDDAADTTRPAVMALAGREPRVRCLVNDYGRGPANAIRYGIDHAAAPVVVVDDAADTTRPTVMALAGREPRVRCLVNDYGRGPANAIRYGIDHAAAPVVVVTMADGCDDVRQVDDLVRLVERGVAVAAASRYMAGGQQVGGPLAKGLMSATAGRSLRLLARVGTRDATNSFKAYNTAFVRAVGIDSRDGFEIGIELTAKARRLRLPIAEIPTIWLDRQDGLSNFKIANWLPKYLRWYKFAFGRQLDLDELKTHAGPRRPG
jgi:dolichol-phosphate mannosyltransferase